jgi:hypothetical protein
MLSIKNLVGVSLCCRGDQTLSWSGGRTAHDSRPTMAGLSCTVRYSRIFCGHWVSRLWRRRGGGQGLNRDAPDRRTFCACEGKRALHSYTPRSHSCGPCVAAFEIGFADVDGHRASVTQFHRQPLHDRSARTHTRTSAARNDRPGGWRSSQVHRSRRNRAAVDRYRCL